MLCSVAFSQQDEMFPSGSILISRVCVVLRGCQHGVPG